MSTDESELRAWAYLMRVAEPPHTGLRDLVEAEGPVAAAAGCAGAARTPSSKASRRSVVC